jgi:hypothetical protein
VIVKISFFFRNINNASAKSGFIEVLVSVMSFFEIEKILSQLACDAGIPKYLRANLPINN